MRVLITGTRGQVGKALLTELRGFEIIAADRARMDLSSPDAIVRTVREIRPQVIVNPAAFTAVDLAESERASAVAVNTDAPAILAQEARRLGALLVHFSTDYVFDGALRRPYTESDKPNPLSVYGRTKLDGEEHVRASGCRHVILRTSWVYGGEVSFPALILKKASLGEVLRVVDDQTGVPTWASDLALLTRDILEVQPVGTWHASAAGEVTRYAYALEVLRLAGVPVEVLPVPTSQFLSPAKRPAYSALDSSALGRQGINTIGPWRERLAACMRACASRLG